MTTNLHPEQARKQFFEVFKDCYWNPKLKIKTTSNEDRIVVTDSSIESGEPLVILNDSICFGLDKANQYTIEPLNDLSSDLIIAGYLYQYYCGHALCPEGYDLYFNALPTYEWYKNNHEMLKVYLSLTLEKQQELEDAFYLFNQLNKFLDWASSLSNLSFNKEHAIRALIAVTTRSWSSSGLVPWIDFFNHASDGSLLNKNVGINATHKYKKGDEVNTSYGVKDSFKLLSIYGYCTSIKTLGLVRMSVSDYALALDKELKEYQAATEYIPFLLDTKLENFETILAHFRLVALNKYDVIQIKDLNAEYKVGLNGSNEFNAVKSFLFCLKKTQEDLETISTRIVKAFESVDRVPFVLREEFEIKMNIISLAKDKIFIHWNSLLDNVK